MERRESTLRKLRKNKQKTFGESIRRKLKLGQIECTRMYDYTVAKIHLPKYGESEMGNLVRC